MTILLLLIAGFAFVAVVIFSSTAFGRRGTPTADRMDLAARICEASARDAFSIELDYSIESLPLLDNLIERGFASGSGATDDTKLVLAAYVGQVFVRAGKAIWQEARDDSNPRLLMRDNQEVVSPFEIINQKLQAPESINVAATVRGLISTMESSKNDAQ
ncbi:MAG: hypothetical protein Q8922_10615 [Bacteroidota bacterium]|nr:hypothetical protein [Bacteroidota bacterium]MDP4233026.1 hypothetical protein [Bacteroidota bacterium]MDP4241829.1 hypothetical protein [Bacteroidota bacterium]MDP4288378.1 hypothetical protein [Bacteroidota bacterium]